MHENNWKVLKFLKNSILFWVVSVLFWVPICLWWKYKGRGCPTKCYVLV